LVTGTTSIPAPTVSLSKDVGTGLVTGLATVYPPLVSLSFMARPGLVLATTLVYGLVPQGAGLDIDLVVSEPYRSWGASKPDGRWYAGDIRSDGWIGGLPVRTWNANDSTRGWRASPPSV
jgi:hypothetical protein